VGTAVRGTNGRRWRTDDDGRNTTNRDRLLELKSAVLDETVDFVAIIDVRGHVRYANRMLSDTLGLAPGDGRSLFETLAATDRERFVRDVGDALGQRGVVRTDLSLVAVDGAEIPVSVVLIAHRDFDGTVECVSFVARDETAHREMRDRLSELALYDPLTTLPNRRLFTEFVDRVLAQADRNQTTTAVIFIDLDGFKVVNDTFGHDAGDAVLFTVAGRLNASLRAADMLARIGGDEFAAVCASVTVDEAAEIAGRMIQRAAEPVRWQTTDTGVTASIGVALGVPRECSADDLVREADRAMYAAKRAGKNRSVIVNAAR
jgi:diguanylate cyclase (GGDEF)-like protein/PAS domain S-box-containing protein